MKSFIQDADFRLRVPIRHLSCDELTRMQLRYYNPAVHQAAFVLPQFAAIKFQQFWSSILCYTVIGVELLYVCVTLAVMTMNNNQIIIIS